MSLVDGHRDTLRSEICFKSSFLEVRADHVRLPNGNTHDYLTVQHPGAAAIVPIDEHGRILMVRQHRQALDDNLLELPAGKLEPDEDPWIAARRELMEETGFACSHLELLVSYYTSPGFTDERIHVFEARGLQAAGPPPGTDDDEPIAIEWLEGEQVLEAIQDGRIVDGKTILGITLLKLKEHSNIHEID